MTAVTLGLGAIRIATRRLSFGPEETGVILAFLKKEERNRLVVKYHRCMGNTAELCVSHLDDGILILTCPQIELDFLFVHLDNGRGLFGGQKSRFQTYIGDANNDDFAPANSFGSFALALFGINNVFRGQGFLKGGAY